MRFFVEVDYKMIVKGYDKCYRVQELLSIFELFWIMLGKEMCYFDEECIVRRKVVVDD